MRVSRFTRGALCSRRCRPFCSRQQPRHRSSSSFVFGDVAQLRSKSTCRPNSGKISESTAEILLLAVSEIKRPPYWNSTSGFDFLPLRHHRHVVLHVFVKIRSKWDHPLGVTASYSFSRWQPRHCSSTSDFVFRDFAQLGRSKSTYRTNV